MAACALMAVALGSCDNKKFRVEGAITEAKDSVLYFENMSLDGPVAVDSVKLGDDGTFSFSEKSPEAPEFYRLRIAGQIINLSVDSTETVTVKAAYPAMSTGYTVEGSDECATIKELALKQIGLLNRVIAVERNPMLGVDLVRDSVTRMIEAYKQDLKMNYIYKAPMRQPPYIQSARERGRHKGLRRRGHKLGHVPPRLAAWQELAQHRNRGHAQHTYRAQQPRGRTA